MGMLLGVLRMPPKLWDNGPIDQIQRHGRYIEAADLIEKFEADRDELLAALDTLTLVVGLTPITGNKDALQEAMDIARAVIAKHKAGEEG